MKHDSHYNTQQFPHYVLTDGNHSIWSDGTGHCAAIPTPVAQKKGCLASHFGDMRYTRMVKGIKRY